MIYENITYEEILDRMLNRVDDRYDKRESSIIYSALAPVAAELALLYMEFDIILQDTFGDTASRDYLIRRASERGVIPYQATASIVKGVFTPNSLDIPIGSRFSLNDLNYVVIDKIRAGEYQLSCEEFGTIGNESSGALVPIDYIENLESAIITDLLVPGVDEEDTEDIRQRYFESFNNKQFGGNKKDYIEHTNAIEGVGGTKVYPVWNGGGTVKLVIVDGEYSPASPVLINNVQTVIDPTNDAEGEGIAPIGHVVTVDTVNEVSIDILLNITFNEGYSYAGMEETIKGVISEYFDELRITWANEAYLIVRISQIESRLLELTAILDINNTKLNGLEENVILNSEDLPKLGSVAHA